MSEALLVQMMFADRAKCLDPRGQVLGRRTILAMDHAPVGGTVRVEVSRGAVLPFGARIVTEVAAYMVTGYEGDGDFGYARYRVRCLRRRAPRPLPWLPRLLARMGDMVPRHGWQLR